ncbi:hypothetical protein [Streptomyces sp. TRM49041]|uniref:hypothetical protein n=1 Tax=Streptomyces sp. TRM49041 TaxID=2603216 RepID=UPI0011EBB5C9|nr:hypothetical protein [Streptomyces sp. TRM49041]
MVEEKGERQQPKPAPSVAVYLIVGVPALAGVMALIAALSMWIAELPASLIVATLALSAVIFSYLGATVLWRFLAVRGPAHEHPEVPELSDAMSKTIQLAVTVQGVVLGLIFAFLRDRAATITVQVGAVSLVVGVILGLLLYTLVSYEVSAPGCLVMAGLLSNFTVWSAGYGLTCLVTSLFAHPFAIK